MKERKTYLGRWFQDFKGICGHELKQIFSDWGVMLIFFVAGLAYPLLYNVVYLNGILNDTPVAVVDEAACSQSREFIRQIDATREVEVAYKCINMDEAQRLMQERKVKGIILFPRDFGDKLARMETAVLSVYADMSSFLYYKNALMATNFVMLDNIRSIQIERYEALGYTAQEASQLTQPLLYEENNPYNRAFSYNIFLVTAILLIIIQQTMFYGMSLLAGTQREKNNSFASLPDRLSGHGVGRVVLGRGMAYWLVYVAVGLYIAFIVPAIFGLPQRGNFFDILLLLLFFVTDCVLFSETWSVMISRRETVFVLFLAISPICLFLTGTSWPTISFSGFWKIFSYIFPSTFGVQAFLNMNSAGGDLSAATTQIFALSVQTIIYYFLASATLYAENWAINHKREIEEVREKIDEKRRLDRRKNAALISGEEA
ncbi:MAG: ABC transporter permease [Bacteroidales bacterium]|nr:ABC transporter permease [Bacteroidales bacterium]